MGRTLGGGWAVVVVACLVAAGCARPLAKDLAPPRVMRRAAGAPVVLVKDGQPKATIAVMVPKERYSAVLQGAVKDLQHFVKLATGAELRIEQGKVSGPAIVIGAPALGGDRMPVEGFAIRTEVDSVLIGGRDGEVAPHTFSYGTAWGIYDFLERFVGVRWYFPGDLGCSVPKSKDLVVPPVWLEDAPVFPKREIWPSGGPTVTPLTGTHHRRMRSNDAWPVRLQVHSPTGWPPLYGKERPECFELRSDGTRNFDMLCYGHPRTLETYLETIAAFYEKGEKAAWGGKPPIGNAITVSPNDMAVSCTCEFCRKLWDKEGGQYGTASRVVATFVANLAREVKKRWPDKRIIYLPYQNYTNVPAGVEFPDNVEVQLCGMPGLAQYKEPAIAASEQANIDGWVRLTGRKIQNWHYSCWPEDQTRAAYLFPHVANEHYRLNRHKTVGSFINGERDHWDRQGLSLYVWMKSLWNPDFDVDAVIAEYCRRMFGPAAKTMHALVTMQIDGWEKSRWPGAVLSPKGIYEVSYPRARVLKMEALLKRAREQAAGDELVLKRLDYIGKPLADFFAESRDYSESGNRTPLLVAKAAAEPLIDGRLDDPAWATAKEVAFIRALDKANPQCQFPTTLKAVWTPTGVTFGFRMAEPTPDKLRRDIKGPDDSLAWWNDNVELFLDVAGQRTGYYQLIINPNAAVFDAKGHNVEWKCDGLKAAVHVGGDFWSLEVFVPCAAFPEALRPAAGVQWYGNFTRHRVCDGKPREYQRLNTTFAGPSNNMMAFGPIRFME